MNSHYLNRRSGRAGRAKTFLRRATIGAGFLALAFMMPAILASVASQTAHATDAKGNFSIRGGGTVLCKNYVNASPAGRKIAETWWAGYLTAINRTTKDTYDILGNLSVKNANDWLLRYCKKYPGRRFAFAVHDLLKAAYGSRTKSMPK